MPLTLKTQLSFRIFSSLIYGYDSKTNPAMFFRLTNILISVVHLGMDIEGQQKRDHQYPHNEQLIFYEVRPKCISYL